MLEVSKKDKKEHNKIKSQKRILRVLSDDKEETEKESVDGKAKDRSDDSASSASEGCDGPISDEELAEVAASGCLSVSGVDHNSFIPTSYEDFYLPETFPSGKRRHHKRNLVIEGSCNYFFWMEKIAMVSSRKNPKKLC